MRFMNEMDIERAFVYRRNHPTLGPATRTLYNLMKCANANSDGWAYWPKPTRAASKLMELIEGDGTFPFLHGERDDVTPEKVRAAYRPIRAFLTRHKLECQIEDL